MVLGKLCDIIIQIKKKKSDIMLEGDDGPAACLA